MHKVKNYIDIVNVMKDKLVVLENSKQHLTHKEKQYMFDDVRAMARQITRGIVDLD